MYKYRRAICEAQLLALRCVLEEQQVLEDQQRKQRKRKRIWTRKWIARRAELGFANGLMMELAEEEPNDFRDTIRMTESQFNELLALVGPRIQRKDTYLRMAIPATVKLQVALSFLAHGSTFKMLSREFRVPVCSISLFLPETLEAIRHALSPYLKVSAYNSIDFR
jgi:hypothetical protein